MSDFSALAPTSDSYHIEKNTSAESKARLTTYIDLGMPLSLRAELVAQLLRAEFGNAVSDFLKSDASTLLIHGLPVKPDSSSRVDAVIKTPLADSICLGLACTVGNPYAYTLESATLVQDVVPRQSSGKHRTSSGESPLGYHTDLDYFPGGANTPFGVTNPDAIVLLCIQPDSASQAATRFVDGRILADALPRRDFAELLKPQYRLPASYSFSRTPLSSRPWSSPTPLMRMSDDQVLMTADLLPGLPRTEDLPVSWQGALTLPGGRALNSLREYLESSGTAVTSITLKAGDALILHNRKGLHSRTGFTASYGGADRRLKRIYVRSDMGPLAQRRDYIIPTSEINL